MKIAVVLYNLGGPDSLTAIRPFLQNLFSDPAIIGLPFFLRLPLARLIAGRREKDARPIYEALGGASPLLPNTQAQADALETALNAPGADTYKCFVIMRYWHPRAAAVAQKIAAFAPDEIVELPLYPQFSTTTSQSSFDECARLLRRATKKICCYPTLSGFIAAQAQRIKPVFEDVAKKAAARGCTAVPRILFSAHGLPEKIVRAGDPYQMQCTQTAEALRTALQEMGVPTAGSLNTYQSRVGPLKWIGPATDAEIIRAGAEGVPVVIVPIAFVSEHSETLYEIEQEYRALAAEKGVPAFGRVETVGTHPAFIEGLAALVRQARSSQAAVAPAQGQSPCGAGGARCPCHGAA